MFKEFKIDAKDFDGPVLVTGASGCIGSWALSLLQEAGVPVFALDLQKDTRRPSLLMSESELRQVKWLVGDISEPATINKAIEHSKATSIIHLAALQVPFCKADPIAGARVNVVGTINAKFCFHASNTQLVKTGADHATVQSAGSATQNTGFKQGEIGHEVTLSNHLSRNI